MMPRSDFDEGGPDERYTMQSILDGDWDGDLRRWCADAAAGFRSWSTSGSR
jgi:hypothetical protein